MEKDQIGIGRFYISDSDLNQGIKVMKRDEKGEMDARKNAEERVGHAVRQLHQTLARNLEDISTVLDGYYMTHDYESEEPSDLLALTKGYKGIMVVLKQIEEEINKGQDEKVD